MNSVLIALTQTSQIVADNCLNIAPLILLQTFGPSSALT